MTRWPCLLVLAACGSSPAPCERIAAHAGTLLQVLGPELVEPPDPRARLHDMILARCTADDWPEAARTCFLAATSFEALVACRPKLTEAQSTALGGDLAAYGQELAARANEERKKLETAPVSGPTVELKPGEVEVAERSLVVEIPLEGDIVVGGNAVADRDVDGVFGAAFARDKDTQVVLQVDAGVAHGRVVDIMEHARGAGLTRLALRPSAPR